MEKTQTQTRKIEVEGNGRIHRAATFVPRTINEEKRTIELTWSTGALVRRYDWWSGEQWNEVLSMDQRHVKLDRLNNGAPLLADHRSWSIEGVRGVVEKAWIENGEGVALVRFDTDEDSEKAWQKVKNGTVRKVSIGYQVNAWEVSRGRNGELDTLTAIDWEPYEISLVAVPADDNAKIRSEGAQQKFVTTVIENVRMDPNIPNPNGGGGSPSAQSQEQIDAQVRAAAENARKAEMLRVKEINEAVRSAKLPQDFADTHIEAGTSVDEVRKLVIAEFGKQDPNAGARNAGSGGPDGKITADERDKFRSAAVDGLMLRAGAPGTSTIKDQGSLREFRAMSVKELAKECLERSGVTTRGMSATEIWETARNIGSTRSLSTSDFPWILADTMRKSLDAAYQEAPRTFLPWTRREDLPDFREMNNVKMGDASPLLQVVEGAEYLYGRTTENNSTWRIYKYGRLLRYTWEMFVNDDMSAFNRLGPMMSRQVAQLQSNIVYSLLLSNPVLNDGDPLFHANHNNLGTTGAVSNTTIAEMRKKFLQHKTLGDGTTAGDIMNLMAKFLIVGPEQLDNALRTVEGIIVPNTIAEVNTVKGMGLTVIQEGRITGNQWYGAASPMDVDTIKYGFLQGEPEIRITEEESFNVDAVTLKIRSTFGAHHSDEYRGLYKNAGS